MARPQEIELLSARPYRNSVRGDQKITKGSSSLVITGLSSEHMLNIAGVVHRLQLKQGCSLMRVIICIK